MRSELADPTAARVGLVRLADILYEAPHALVVTDVLGTVLWTDRRFAEMTGRETPPLGAHLETLLTGVPEMLLTVQEKGQATVNSRLLDDGQGPVKVLAVRGRGRGRDSLLWGVVPLDESRAEPEPEDMDFDFAGPERRAVARRRKWVPPMSTPEHLDALRLLHELALAPVEAERPDVH